MLPYPVDIIGFFGSYLLLMMVYNAIHQSKSHTLGGRMAAAFFSYAVVLFLTDYAINVLLLTYKAIATPFAFFEFFGVIFFTGLLIRGYFYRPEKLNIDEMQNFIKASLLFGNYFRLKDVDTQEQIGTYKMKKLYQEVHGKPFTDDVIATPFDQQVTTFKKVTIEELKEKKKRFPPEYFEEVEQLKKLQTTNVSVSFRFQLMDNTAHSLLAFMEHFEIAPSDITLTIDLVYPMEKKIPFQTSTEQMRIVERIYESLQVLIDQEWFSLYVPFFSNILMKCGQKEFTMNMNETVRQMLTFKISLRNLRLHSSRITTVTEIMKIADIRFL